jgi:hypothetical protein
MLQTILDFNTFPSITYSLQWIQHYVIKFVSELRQLAGFPRVLGVPPRYNRNILESGDKHHKPIHKISIMFHVISCCLNYVLVHCSIFENCLLASHNVVSSTTHLRGIRTHNVRGDRH